MDGNYKKLIEIWNKLNMSMSFEAQTEDFKDWFVTLRASFL